MRHNERSIGLTALRNEMAEVLQTVNPGSNLDFIHILQSQAWKGELDWHRDIVESDKERVGYIKGRFRVGLNLGGTALLTHIDPSGKEITNYIAPGTLYINDNSYNSLHKSKNLTDEFSSPRRLLVLTDVAETF